MCLYACTVSCCSLNMRATYALHECHTYVMAAELVSWQPVAGADVLSSLAQVRSAAYELLAALRSLHEALIVAGGGMPLAPSQSPGVSSQSPSSASSIVGTDCIYAVALQSA